MAGVITASVVSGFFANEAANTQADAAKSAANTSADAQRYAQDIQYKMFQEQKALQKPWQEAGVNALNKLVPLASNYQKFGMDQFQQDPGYAFRLAEGNKALNQAAAARGGLISGNALKAAQRYGQEMGSQEYNNAFQRYLREREAQLNPLQSLAGVGQTSAQTLGGQAGQYGSNISNLAMTNAANQGNALMAAGNARASSYGAIGSALGQGLQGIYNNQNAFSNMFGGGSSGGGGDTTLQGPMYQSMLSQGATLNPDGTLSY